MWWSWKALSQRIRLDQSECRTMRRAQKTVYSLSHLDGPCKFYIEMSLKFHNRIYSLTKYLRIRSILSLVNETDGFGKHPMLILVSSWLANCWEKKQRFIGRELLKYKLISKVDCTNGANDFCFTDNWFFVDLHKLYDISLKELTSKTERV